MSDDNRNINIDKAENMIDRIIFEEANNVKNGKNNKAEMVKRIQKIIEEEAECL